MNEKSFLDGLKSMLSSLAFLLGLCLVVVIYLSSQATSFGSLLGMSFLGAALAFVCAEAISSWLRGWSPSWIVLDVLRRNDKQFVVAKDRIGRKRIFVYDVIWSEVDGGIPNNTLKIALDEVIRHN